ncbi:MAG: hypothetical protein ACI8QT_002194, partial [Halioglobus sp.]
SSSYGVFLCPRKRELALPVIILVAASVKLLS